MKKETMEALKFEEEQLVEKIKVSSERGEFGTYKNLVQALERILYLQERFQEISKTMWSKYKMVKEGKEIDVVSIWEQQGDKVQNQRVFEIKEEIINDKNVFDITDYVMEYKYTNKNDRNIMTSEIKRINLKINRDVYYKYLNKDIKCDKRVIFEGKTYRILGVDKTTFSNMVNIIIW